MGWRAELSLFSRKSIIRPNVHLNIPQTVGTDLHNHKSPTISFLRRFFGSSVTPAAMSAAKTKAQDIIDNNAVGMLVPCGI